MIRACRCAVPQDRAREVKPHDPPDTFTFFAPRMVVRPVDILESDVQRLEDLHRVGHDVERLEDEVRRRVVLSRLPA